MTRTRPTLMVPRGTDDSCLELATPGKTNPKPFVSRGFMAGNDALYLLRESANRPTEYTIGFVFSNGVSLSFYFFSISFELPANGRTSASAHVTQLKKRTPYDHWPNAGGGGDPDLHSSADGIEYQLITRHCRAAVKRAFGSSACSPTVTVTISIEPNVSSNRFPTNKLHTTAV